MSFDKGKNSWSLLENQVQMNSVPLSVLNRVKIKIKNIGWISDCLNGIGQFFFSLELHLLKCVHVVVGWWNRDEFVCQLKESTKIEFWEKYKTITKHVMKAEMAF